MASLFERFHRGSNVDDRHFAGLGLGLYICRQIVIQHGGRIWAESTLGKGSTFHVELPLTHGALAEPSQMVELAGA
jgi:signal transduction histidine kinase